MVATLFEAFLNFDGINKTEQQMIEEYCSFITENIQYYSLHSDKPKCINNSTKPVSMPPCILRILLTRI